MDYQQENTGIEEPDYQEGAHANYTPPTTKEILQRNYNDTFSYQNFFGAFGYKYTDTIYLRRFDDKKERQELAARMQVELGNFSAIIPTLQNYNGQGCGIYFVVNGGGQTDAEVRRHKIARAQFIEIDPPEKDLERVKAGELEIDDLLAEQLEKILAFPLEPSMIIRTWKSLHCYWLLDDGKIELFPNIQERLIQYFGSDPTIKNESRVMRLYGFNHCKYEPVLVRLIKAGFEKYTQEQFNEILPPLTTSSTTGTRQRTNPTPTAGTDGIIPHGHRHYYIVKRIGEIIGRMGADTAPESVLAMVDTDFRLNCADANEVSPEDIEKGYLPTIKRYLEQKKAEDADPDFYKYAMRAWRAENPGKQFDSASMSWDEVREAGRRAQEAGKRFDAGYSTMQAATPEPDLEDFGGPAADRGTDAATDPGQNAPAAPADPGQTQPEAGQTEQAAGQEKPKQHFIDKFLEQSKGGAFKPCPTGVKWFDNFLDGGMESQTMLELMAAPGTGKTTLVQNIVEGMARNGRPVVYFCLEMSREQMLAKAISMYSAENATELDSVLTSKQVLHGYEWDSRQENIVTTLLQEYKKKNYPNIRYLDSNFSSHIEDILDCLKRYAEDNQKRGILPPVAVIDYLHFVTTKQPGIEVPELLKMTLKGIKQYCVNYNTTAIVISAINRASTGAITLTSGRDSSNIEYTGDYILSYEYQDIDAGLAHANNPQEMALIQQTPLRKMRLRALKTRGGPVGHACDLRYDAAHNIVFHDFMPGYVVDLMKQRGLFPEGLDNTGQQDAEQLPPPIPAKKGKRQ